MTRSITPQINGVRLSSLDRRLVVDYVYPGTIDVHLIDGVRLPSKKDATTVELGRFDHAAGAWFEERRWTWNAARVPSARVWVQNVLAAHDEQKSRSYEHDGELVLIWHRLPTRSSEQALLAEGFQPSLATWRAAPTDRRRAVVRAVLANEAVTPRALAREQTRDGHELKERAQHAWMRWFVVFGDTLEVGGRTYKISGRPTLRGDVLALDLDHSSGGLLQVRLDVSKHPLHYPASVDGSVTFQRESVAWEDFPGLAAEIGGILDARKKAQQAATKKPAGKRGGSRARAPAPVRPRELEALPPATATAPTWADRFVDAFNADAGPQLAFSRHRGGNTLVFVIHAEERPDRPLAAIDTRDERIVEIRWLDESVPPAQRTALGERLERALADVQPELADALSHAAIEKLKARAIELGADPERTMHGAGGDEYRWLAETLRDLAEPRGMSQDDLASWLTAHSLRAAAEKVRKHSDEQALDDFLRELWDQIAGLVVLHPVDRARDGFAVHPRTIHESDQGFVIVLREADAEGRPRVVPVALREDCEDERCVVESDELVGGEHAWHLGVEWDYRFIHDLYHNIRSFERSVRTAPARLADVREMLFWTAAMIDTPRCRGESRRTAEAAFRDAKEHYDRARVLVAQGDSLEGLRAIHAALRKIAAAAVELASSCGVGQTRLPGTPAQLRVEMRAPTISTPRRRAMRRGPPRVAVSKSPPEQPPPRRKDPEEYEEREFYLYKGYALCPACGEAIRRQLHAQGMAPANPRDESTYYDEEYPKGPYTSDAADAPAHCGRGRDCLDAETIETEHGPMRVGAFIGNPLTERGDEYVRESVAMEKPEAVQIWGPFYELPGVTRYHVGQALATLSRGGREALQEWAASEDPSAALLDFADEQIRDGVITTTAVAAVREALRLIASEDRLPLNPGGDVEAEDQFVLDAFHVRGLVPELVPHLPWGFELVLYTAGTRERAAVIDVIDRETIEFHWYDPAMPHAMRRKIEEKIERVMRMATEESRTSKKSPRRKPPPVESTGTRGAVTSGVSPLAPGPWLTVQAAAGTGRDRPCKPREASSRPNARSSDRWDDLAAALERRVPGRR